LVVFLFSLKNNWIFGNITWAFCRIAGATVLVGIQLFLFHPFLIRIVMKTTKILVAAACALCLSTTAFAQTTPAAGTMQNGTNSGTMQNGTMTTPSQTGTDRMQTGTMQNGTMQNGTMQNGTMNGRMNDKTKMNSRKGTKKSKMSTTPSSTGTM
jgi:hypothetical protein